MVSLSKRWLAQRCDDVICIKYYHNITNLPYLDSVKTIPRERRVVRKYLQFYIFKKNYILLLIFFDTK